MTQGFIYDQYGNHATKHQDGGADEISVAGLSGLLADDQHVLDAEVLAAFQTSASVSLPTSTWTTVYTFPTVTDKIQMYIVGAGLRADDVVNYSGYAIIAVNNVSVKVLAYAPGNAGYFQIQMSGMNLQLWQASGTTQIGYASIMKFMALP